MKTSTFLLAALVLLTLKSYAQTVTDIDGNVYNTVNIGTQVWMKENLKVTHYQNGILIPNLPSTMAWTITNKGARSYYDNDSTTYANTYGALYNWHTTMDTSKLCPIGWHIPSIDEWNELVTFIGGESIAGGKLKDTILWSNPNVGATNSTGFSLLPSGNRGSGGSFGGNGFYSLLWTSTVSFGNDSAWRVYISFDSPLIDMYPNATNNGFPIRCIKDSTTQINKILYPQNIKIYPNPTNDLLYVTCDLNQDIKLELYNILGECVLQKEIKHFKNEIEIKNLEKGLYLIIINGSDWKTQKLIIKE